MKAGLLKHGLRCLSALAPWAVLVVGLAATAWHTVSEHREMKARDEKRFEQEVVQASALIETRLRTQGQALMGLRDWFTLQETMSDRLWTNYVHTFHAPANYPGLYDFGFAEFVRDIDPLPSTPNLDAHLKRMLERFGPEYKLTLPPTGREGFNWYHFPVTWHSYSQWRIEPLRPYHHYGMDLNQDPDLWAAMNWALGQDVPALSGKQQIDPDDASRTGLMIFLPVYRRDLELDRDVQPSEFELRGLPTQQRADLERVKRYQHYLRGLVFGGIDMNAFLQHHLGTNTPTVTFALHASTNHLPGALPAQLLFDNRTRPGAAPAHLQKVLDLPLYGRVLRFTAEPGPGFSSAPNSRSLALSAVFGVATTLLLSGFIAYQARVHRKEQEISTALRRSEASLQTLLYERMSRDLHDGTIQSLYAVGLGLGQLRRMMSSTSERERLEAGLTELDRVVAELRGYLIELDPGVSPSQSAAAALAQLIARLRQTTATDLHFTAQPGTGDGWPPAAVLDLLQVAREGISNALRHGQATAVELSLRRADPNGVLFTISDNGKGFDPSQNPGQGHGLANLERRAKAWNGDLRIESHPGGPTRLTITFAPSPG